MWILFNNPSINDFFIGNKIFFLGEKRIQNFFYFTKVSRNIFFFLNLVMHIYIFCYHIDNHIHVYTCAILKKDWWKKIYTYKLNKKKNGIHVGTGFNYIPTSFYFVLLILFQEVYYTSSVNSRPQTTCSLVHYIIHYLSFFSSSLLQFYYFIFISITHLLYIIYP